MQGSVARACILSLLLLAGCFASPYEPGALTDAPGGRTHANARRVTACLDVAAWAIRSNEVAPKVLLRIDFANRCDRSFTIDLSKLEVEGSFGEGSPRRLVPFDPYQTIRPGRLAPHEHASENLAFGAANHLELPRSVCVDVSELAHDARERESGGPVCFGPGDDGFVQREEAAR
jgi:hypothetical protein